MDIVQYIDALETAGGALADACEQADLAVRVPSCPEWTVRDLAFHQGGVHLWAARIVREALMERPVGVAMDPIADAAQRPADDALVGWVRDGAAALVDALRSAPDDLAAWTFMRTAPTPRAFWARRQAHETVIHRVDGQQAAGVEVTPVDPEVAADGVDELLTGFLASRRGRLRAPAPTTLTIRTTDTGAAWRLTVSAEPLAVERVDGAEAPVDTEVSGPAHDIYLAVWNRQPMDRLQIDGDRTLIDRWPELAQVI